MAIDFPASPIVGQTYLFNGVTYTYSTQGVWTVTTPAITQVAFRATKTIDQAGIPSVTFTKIIYGNEVYDNGNRYDPVLSRWTPPAGLVMLTASAYLNGGLIADSILHLSIYKNGAEFSRNLSTGTGQNSSGGISVNCYDIANGSDYYEVFIYASTIAPFTIQGTFSTIIYFEGCIPTGPQGPQGLQGLAGSVTAPTMSSGRLTYVSATQLAFKPYNGDMIKINGILYPIPPAGIAGLGNTGVFVSGVAGQNLATTGRYMVYAFNNAGTITADFWPHTGAGLHATSTTPGNVGVEVRQGDDTRTLIGLVYLPAGQFVDSQTQRFTISWFNRRNLSLIGAQAANAQTASLTMVELAPAAKIEFVTWGDEGISAGLTGAGLNTAVGQYAIANIGIDGISAFLTQQGSQSSTAIAALYTNEAVFGTTIQPEGYHYLTPIGGTASSGTATFFVNAYGMIQG